MKRKNLSIRLAVSIHCMEVIECVAIAYIGKEIIVNCSMTYCHMRTAYSEMIWMSEKRFKLSEIYSNQIIDTGNCVNNGTHCRLYDLKECVDLLNEQQATISALKDIFKSIITYSEWDSKKPYCSLGIAVDRKTYYKIREILNE